MNRRIKAIRNVIGLTQTEFGARIGVKGNTVTGYETGIRNPSDAVIFSICREFNVCEEWLRTGQGEMFRENSLKNEMEYYIEELLEDYGDNPFYDMIVNMVKTYAELDEKSKKVIRDCAKKFQDNIKVPGETLIEPETPAAAEPELRHPQEFDKLSDEEKARYYYEGLKREKEAKEKSGA